MSQPGPATALLNPSKPAGTYKSQIYMYCAHFRLERVQDLIVRQVIRNEFDICTQNAHWL